MGLFFSCCRRNKDSKDREPLLPKHRVDAAANEYLPSQTQLEKLADVVAAFRTGKMPSQEQLTRAIQLLLRLTSPSPSYGTLSDQGQQVISDSRALLDVLLQFGLEKNDDNELQELIYHCSKIPVIPVHADFIVNADESSTLEVQGVVGEIPSREEAQSDAKEIIHSIRRLSTILLTSSTFRIILSDLFKVAREVIADTAADVGRVAATVEASAEKVEEALRPESSSLEDVQITSKVARDEIVGEASEVSEATLIRWGRLSAETPERTKEAVVGRLQQAIAQAHSNSDYQDALRTILYLLQEYADRLRNISIALSDAKAPTITPVIWTDPHLSRFFAHLTTIISRLASGKSVTHWINCLRTVVVDLGKVPMDITANNDELHELRIFFGDLGSWLDEALDSPQYATSSVGQHNAEALYDRAHNLVSEASHSDKPWAQHIRDLIRETERLLDAIANDRTTNRLIEAASTLSTSISNYTRALARQAPGRFEESKRQLRNQLQRDVLQWLLPRVLRALHAIPVPRVEFRSNSLDAAIDTLYLTPSSAQLSLVPDHIHVQNWTELHLDMTEVHPEVEAIIPAVEFNGMETHTKLRVSIRGVRVSARDIAYYACYRIFGSSKWLSWLGYEDEGLASVDVGGRGIKDDGLSVEFELQFPPDGEANAEDSQPLFFVRDVRVDVPGLQLSLDRSKHWILNKILLQPLAAPVGRLATAWVLRSQIHTLLESVADMGGKVVDGARRSAKNLRREPETSDYVNAVWRVLTAPSDESTQSSGYHDDVEETPVAQTHTKTATKGIVRTTATYPAGVDDATDTIDPIEESTLAIGVGEQILPGKGGPHDGHDEEGQQYGPRELAREALDQLQSRVDEVVEAEETAIGRATELRRETQDATERERQMEREQEADGGWRSEAFDL